MADDQRTPLLGGASNPNNTTTTTTNNKKKDEEHTDPATRLVRVCCGRRFLCFGMICGPKRVIFSFLVFGFIVAFLSVFFVTLISRSASGILEFDFPVAEPNNNTNTVMYVHFNNLYPADKGSSLDVSIDLKLDPALLAATTGGPDRAGLDITIEFSEGHAEIARYALVQVSQFQVPLLDGTVYDYPFDKYSLRAPIRLFSSTLVNDYTSEPFRLELDLQEISAFYFSAELKNFTLHDNSTALGLDVLFYRPGLATIYPVLVLCGFWCVLISLGFIMTSNIFLKFNRNNPAQLTIIASTMFALPALRNSMPSAPPFGATIDFIGFFWAEIAGFLTFLVLSISYWREAYQNYHKTHPTSKSKV